MPLASCIQVSMETKDPICGPYPGFGPMMLRFESLASAISGRKRAPPNRVENPAVRAADPLRKLLRLEKHSLLKLCRAMKSCLPAAMACLLQYLNNRLVIPLTGTGAADSLSSKFDLATKIDSFTALRADDPLTFIARKLFRRQLHVDWLGLEELVIGHFSIGQHLLLVLAFNFRVHAFGQGLGRFACGHAHGLACFHINKGSGNLAPVAKLESALAQAAAGHDHHGVRGATVDFNKGDDALAVLALGIFQTKFFQAEHGHADAENLSGTEMAVRCGGIIKIFLQRLHCCGPSSSAVSGCRSALCACTTKLVFSPAAVKVTRLGARSHRGAAHAGPGNSFLTTGLRLPSCETTI